MIVSIRDDPVRLTFGDAYEAAVRQIGDGSVMQENRKMADVIRRVMADVYMLDPAQRVTIDGEDLTAGQVAEIYRQLTPEHAEEVIDRFRRTTTGIVSVRRYLRSMLYNVFFELEAAEENQATVAEAEHWRRA